MQTKHLEYFVKTAQFQSFSQAAESLFISQQTLSAAIRALENELGVRLFERTKKGVFLTQDGLDILNDAEKILSMLNRWQNLKNRDSFYISGDVYIIGTPVICNTIMIDVILKCKQLYPLVNIHLYESKSGFLLEQASKNSNISIILNSYHTDSNKKICYDFAQKHKLSISQLYKDRYCLYVNTQNPLAQQSSIKLEQLKQLTLACYPDNGSNFAYPQLYNYFNTVVPYNLPLSENLLRVISQDINAAAILSEMISINSYYTQNNICKMLPIDDMNLDIQVYLMHPPLKNCTLPQAKVIDLIKEISSSYL